MDDIDALLNSLEQPATRKTSRHGISATITESKSTRHGYKKQAHQSAQQIESKATLNRPTSKSFDQNSTSSARLSGGLRTSSKSQAEDNGFYASMRMAANDEWDSEDEEVSNVDVGKVTKDLGDLDDLDDALFENLGSKKPSHNAKLIGSSKSMTSEATTSDNTKNAGTTTVNSQDKQARKKLLSFNKKDQSLSSALNKTDDDWNLSVADELLEDLSENPKEKANLSRSSKQEFFDTRNYSGEKNLPYEGAVADSRWRPRTSSGHMEHQSALSSDHHRNDLLTGGRRGQQVRSSESSNRLNRRRERRSSDENLLGLLGSDDEANQSSTTTNQSKRVQWNDESKQPTDTTSGATITIQQKRTELPQKVETTTSSAAPIQQRNQTSHLTKDANFLESQSGMEHKEKPPIDDNLLGDPQNLSSNPKSTLPSRHDSDTGTKKLSLDKSQNSETVNVSSASSKRGNFLEFLQSQSTTRNRPSSTTSSSNTQNIHVHKGEVENQTQESIQHYQKQIEQLRLQIEQLQEQNTVSHNDKESLQTLLSSTQSELDHVLSLQKQWQTDREKQDKALSDAKTSNDRFQQQVNELQDKLENALQERKTLTATLEEEKIQAKEKSTELLKQLESQHEEITQLRHRLSHTDDILRKELDAMHKRHQDAIDKLQQEADARYQALQKRKDSEIESIRRSYKVKIADMEASHALVLQTREQQYQTDLAQLRETTREQIATALHNKENADDIRTLLAKLKNTSEGVDSIQQQMRATVSDQLLQREARLSEREKALETSTDSFKQKQYALDEERRELQRVYAKLEVELREQRTQLEQRQWRLSQDEARIQANQQAMDDQRAALLQQANDERAHMQSLRDALSRERREMLREINEQRRELAEERTTVKQAKREIELRERRKTDQMMETTAQAERTMEKLHAQKLELEQRSSSIKRQETQLEKLKRKLRQDREKLYAERQQLMEAASIVEEKSSAALALHQRAQSDLTAAREAHESLEALNVAIANEKVGLLALQSELKETELRLYEARASRQHVYNSTHHKGHKLCTEYQAQPEGDLHLHEDLDQSLTKNRLESLKKEYEELNNTLSQTLQQSRIKSNVNKREPMPLSQRENQKNSFRDQKESPSMSSSHNVTGCKKGTAPIRVSVTSRRQLRDLINTWKSELEDTEHISAR